jgi:hypothetical protein
VTSLGDHKNRKRKDMCNSQSHEDNPKLTRRQALAGTAAVGATAAASMAGTAAQAQDNPYADPANPALPTSDMVIDKSRVALVITDPQNDFLSPDGVTWGVVGASVEKNNTVANIESLFKAAKAADITVAVSPHYYYPTDKGWKFEGAL